MEVFQNYKNYKKFENDYSAWKENKDISEAKKLEYLKQNKIDEKIKQQEIQRGKALLHAIDVMDEYSQSKAENMEVVTEQIVTQAGSLASYIGAGIGGLTLLLPPVKKGLEFLVKKFPKTKNAAPFIPVFGLGFIANILTIIFMQSWAAKKQVGASRNGRYESMKKELSDPKIFAVLTNEQLNKQEEIAKNIPTTKNMKNGIVAEKSNMANPITALKNIKDALFENKDLEQEREKFDIGLNKKPANPPKLTDEDILKAKKDQQLLHNIVEKIDMSSQDYAENIELATDTATAFALLGGGLTGFLSNSLIKLSKIQNPMGKKIIPWVVGILTTLAISIGATHLQKEGARVGRYLAKKELEKDVNNFVYADKTTTDKLTQYSLPAKKEKENIFKFLIQAVKDNIEYKKYRKTKGVENIKKTMALKDIELTEEQLKDAKMLQKNTFKTFNKIDEKSQAYAESVEAVKSIIEIPVTFISGLFGSGLAILASRKIFKIPMTSPKMSLAMIAGSILGVIPTIFLNAHFTKEQRKASRVAHMLALKEMEKVDNFVDYDNLSNRKIETKTEKTNTAKA